MPILDGISGLIDKLTGNAERKEQERLAELRKQAQQARAATLQREPQQVPVITPDRPALSAARQQNPGPAERLVEGQDKQRVRDAAQNWQRRDPEPVQIATDPVPVLRPTWAPSPAPSPGGPGFVSRPVAANQWWEQQQARNRAEQEARMRALKATPELLQDMVRECNVLEHNR